MGNFKTIAVLVLAEQWLGLSEQKERLLTDGIIMESAARDGSVLVPTVEGNLTCRLNDYIVTDKSGNRSVVDAETFEACHELASDEDVANLVEVVEEVEEVAAEEVVVEEEVLEEAPQSETEVKAKGKKK